MTQFTDISYEYIREAKAASIVIDRPDSLNSLRDETVEELILAFQTAWEAKDVVSVVLSGAGDRAFCVGGDRRSMRDDGSYEGGNRSPIGIRIEALHDAIRDIPKPVIAAVRGYAIGGGQVLQALCDMSIAGDSAIFGQVGPRVGSVDPGFGTAYLARVVGEKKAREMWMLCRQYSAAEAKEMGLVNEVVPDVEVQSSALAWAAELSSQSPAALAMAKLSFNAATESLRGITHMGFAWLGLYYRTPEAIERHHSRSGQAPPRPSPWEH